MMQEIDVERAKNEIENCTYKSHALSTAVINVIKNAMSTKKLISRDKK